MKLIDAFIFYNEFDILHYRLNILKEHVDYFIIVESSHTFSGKEKRLYFNEIKNKYNEINHKIIHIIVEDFPYLYSPNIKYSYNGHSGLQWNNELHQRDCIKRGLNKLIDQNILDNKDIIIISDLDEIINPQLITKIKNNEIIIDLQSLNMEMYYYNLKTKLYRKWPVAKILSFEKYKNMSCPNISSIRKITNCPILENAGWHLSYFGDKYFIQNKLMHFSHQEFNNYNYTDLNLIENKIKSGQNLFSREMLELIPIKDNTNLPIEYEKYLDKFI